VAKSDSVATMQNTAGQVCCVTAGTDLATLPTEPADGECSVEGWTWSVCQNSGQSIVAAKCVGIVAGSWSIRYATVCFAGTNVSYLAYLMQQAEIFGVLQVSCTASPILCKQAASSGVPVSVVAGVTTGCILLFLVAAVCAFSLWRKLKISTALKEFLSAIDRAKPGEKVGKNCLPWELRSIYAAEKVLGKGAYGCVIQAKVIRADEAISAFVAIKFVVAEKNVFNERESRQLNREAQVLRLFTEKKSDNAVHLAGLAAIHVHSKEKICWFVMELLDGDSVAKLTQVGLNDSECNKMSRDVLAALKIMHATGVIHRDVKPDNIVQSKKSRDGASFTYKLIDFGTALGIDEELAPREMMTLQISIEERHQAGTRPYMSPEMISNPSGTKYPTDIWSLAVSMFETVSCTRPFEGDSDTLLCSSICNMDEHAPNILDRLKGERRAKFDHNLAKVIAVAMEKPVQKRYQSADEMYQALYKCLIVKGEAEYSVFISYRVRSEAPLARFIFDELNHSVTPGGHRVTVYWDAHRLVDGEDWEEGFATGLLNSLCFFPLLSYGSTAPLAALGPTSAPGCEEFPVGRRRLVGGAADAEDNVLKELLIARALLDRRAARGLSDSSSEKGILQLAYPVLVGRQHASDHREYPKMGDFFQVQGGGGTYPSTPSSATNRAVAAFLREKAFLPEDSIEAAERLSVKAVMESMTRLQGCNLGPKSAGTEVEIDLTVEEMILIGKGYSVPAVPAAAMGGGDNPGLDEQQLKMLKGLVRLRIADFHSIIDRALASKNGRSRPAESLDGSLDRIYMEPVSQGELETTQPPPMVDASLGFFENTAVVKWEPLPEGLPAGAERRRVTPAAPLSQRSRTFA
jgi:serine/threonine protein kinase